MLLTEPRVRKKSHWDVCYVLTSSPISARSYSDTSPIKREKPSTDGTHPPSPKSPKSPSRRKSRRKEALRSRHRAEDFFAVGNASGSVIAYDPGSLAL